MVGLADITDVGEMADDDRLGIDAFAPHQGGATSVEFVEDRLDLAEIEPGKRSRKRGGVFVLHRRGEEAIRRQHARIARHDDALYSELAGERDRVERTAAAERHQREAAGIEAATHR